MGLEVSRLKMTRNCLRLGGLGYFVLSAFSAAWGWAYFGRHHVMLGVRFAPVE
jgi:hypothetical protein